MADVTPPSTAPAAPCPCGTGRPFGDCCLPILQRQRPAATAEELMRSRFSAHVQRDFEYLHRSHLPTANTPYVPDDDDSTLNWTRLAIHAHELGPLPETAYVDFTAYYRDEAGAEQAVHEKSEFKQVNRTWYYARSVRNGPAPVRSTQAKVGRNDPCSCGSGKKFKHCCGK